MDDTPKQDDVVDGHGALTYEPPRAEDLDTSTGPVATAPGIVTSGGF